MSSVKPVCNAISVDVEDYFHTEAMSPAAPRERWGTFPLRVEQNTDALLELFARHNVRGTFFFLGWVAERFPDLVRRTAAAGHEVGCHSYWHRAVFRLSPEEFREDTLRAKDIIESAIGAPIHGYRAPSFSITPPAYWAFDILAELGFSYDSSVNPVVHPFYGNPTASRHPWKQGAIVEIPMSTRRMFNKNIPIAGGAYLRTLPYKLVQSGVRHLNRVENAPAVLYLHPWEIDPEQPRIAPTWISSRRQYSGLEGMIGKLERLIADFKLDTIQTAFKSALGADSMAAAVSA